MYVCVCVLVWVYVFMHVYVLSMVQMGLRYVGSNNERNFVSAVALFVLDYFIMREV